MEYIAFDSHKQYTLASAEDESGSRREARIEHIRGALTGWLIQAEPGTAVAVEAIGNWYWIVDEIEAAGMVPKLVHARKAKLMMGQTNKTDKLDVRGLNRLQRTGTLPTVWIAPGDLRDRRELIRTRMLLVAQRTRLRNRIHTTLAKYALRTQGTNAFSKGGRDQLRTLLSQLPEHTRFVTERLLAAHDQLNGQIEELQARIPGMFEQTREIDLLMTLPGVGPLLSLVILLEIGDVGRFASAAHLASYAGTTPRVYSSGGKTHFGRLRKDANHYLRWAYIEAANVVAIHRRNWKERHVARLYDRMRRRKGHQKAVGAVARHLAEASYWVLRKSEQYKEPASSTGE